MNPASNTSAQANPLNPGFASVLFSTILIGLKIIGIISAPWWFVLLPVYFWYALVAGIVGLMFTGAVAAVPIIAIALLLGPVIERFFGGKKLDKAFKEALAPTPWDTLSGVKGYEDIPPGAMQDGTMGDHDGPLFGYAKLPNGMFWIGPTKFTGSKMRLGENPPFDSLLFARAPQPDTDTHHEADANNDA